MKYKMLKALAVVAFASLPFTPVVHSAEINVAFQSGTNTIQDTDAERVLRGGVAVTSGAFAIGDIIESVLRFDTANGQQVNVATGSLTYQLTAYSQLRVNNITNNGDGTVRLTFGASNNGALPNGVLAEIHERTSGAQPAVLMADAPATSIAAVKAQTLVATLGFLDANDFWFSDQLNDIGVVAGARPGSGQAAAGVFGLSVLSNPGALPISANAILSPVDNAFHDVVGDASVFARETGTNAAWLVSSNLNASFNSVPEPATMTLLGFALLGLGAGVRRRRS